MFRKRSLLILAVAAILMLAPTFFSGVAVGQGGVDAAGRSLSADASFVPSAPAGVTAAEELLPLVPDGSFENGPPPNSLWTETTNTTCEWILDPTPVWGIPAFNGVYAFWAGGYCCTPNTDTVSQTITVPGGGSATLIAFKANFYRPDVDDADPDYFLVRLGNRFIYGKPMIQANDTYPNWVTAFGNATAFAGQTLPLLIIGYSTGSLTGNVLVDQVSTVVIP
jgi:hypothetical protein